MLRLLALVSFLTVPLGGCGPSRELADPDVGGGAVSTNASTASTTGSGSGATPSECVPFEQTLIGSVEPTDVVVVVDSTLPVGTVTELRRLLEHALSRDDHPAQFILLGDHGPSSDELCLTLPGQPVPPCNDGPSDGPAPPQGTPALRYYDVGINGGDAACALIETSTGDVPDAWGLHPEGWGKWLRPDAATRIVLVTDEPQSCTIGSTLVTEGTTASEGTAFADLVLAQLRARVPRMEDDYSPALQVHSVALFPGTDGAASSPYPATHPLVTGGCSQGPTFGLQALSISTGGSRYALCDDASLDALSTVMEVYGPDIHFECTRQAFPQTVPPGLEPVFDASTPFQEVSSKAQCPVEPGFYYIDGDRLFLCPTTCRAVYTEEGFLDDLDFCPPGARP